MNPKHQVNQQHWERWADEWYRLREGDSILPRLLDNPALAFDGGAYDLIRKYVKDPLNCKACVLGSGDNYSCFALAAIGMDVTSVDISERQLFHARKRAYDLGLSVGFVCSDAIDLQTIKDNSFDLVCSTNGFFVWIDDLQALYREVARVLRPGGITVSYDVHPFQRPWKDDQEHLVMEKPYFDTFPTSRTLANGDQAYERHWTISDILNAIAAAPLAILETLECAATSPHFWRGASYEGVTEASLMDWHTNPRAGLPVWLTVVSRKALKANEEDDV